MATMEYENLDKGKNVYQILFNFLLKLLLIITFKSMLKL